MNESELLGCLHCSSYTELTEWMVHGAVVSKFKIYVFVSLLDLSIRHDYNNFATEIFVLFV